MEIKTKRFGYKGFDVNDKGELCCRGMIFKVGEVARVSGAPEICKNGIHFCWELNDVHWYYNLATSVICEVEPIGEIVADSDNSKCCTNELKIVRMLTKEEVLSISNTGCDNTGFINTGNWNTGNRNTGDFNTGDWNTGDWNTSNFNTGFFNQKEGKCYIFDELSDMTPSEFRNSKYYTALISESIHLTEWVYYTKEEMASDKAKELIGGYLKKYTWEEACANWWSRLTKTAKKTITQIPGFTKEKFKAITNIDI